MYFTNKIFKLLTGFILFWCSVVAIQQEAQAQCQAQITSVTPTGAVCPNTTLNFTGTGQGLATAFDFNSAGLPPGWTSSAFTVGQPCNSPAPDGTDYFWASAAGGVRFMQSSPIDASLGGNLNFELDFGNDDPQPGCEQVDANEGVFLQYSINGGTNWVDIQYFDPTAASGGAIGYDWVSFNIPIPAAAQTASTMFRWVQLNSSGAGFDNWGMDNISLLQTVPTIAHSWDFGDGSPLDTSGGTVSHVYTTPGVYTVTYQATIVGGCTNSTTTTVTVVTSPEIDVLGNGVSIVDGDISPSTTDDTDFGSVSLNGTITYTIQNTGTETLTITSITSDNAEFVVSNVPATVAVGATETFDVTFTPTTFPLQTATITINNDDCDEAVYDFVVQGRKAIPNPLLAPPIPRNFIATAVSTTQINLTWEAISQNITSYELYRNNEFITVLPITAVSYEDTGLDPDTFYTYILIAVNRRAGEVRTTPVATTERTFPEAPVVLSQTDVCGNGNGTAKVTSSGVLYRVYPDSLSRLFLMESSSAVITFPRVSQTTTFYVSVVSHDQESARTAVTINVEPAFEAKIIGQINQISCENTLVLEAQEVEGATYRWFLNGAMTSSAGKSIIATSSGVYQVRVQKGACSILSEPANIRLNFEPVAKITQLNQTRFCDTGTLTASFVNSNATYQWLLDNTIIGEGTSLDISESGVYSLQVTQNGCQATSQIEVFVFPTPQLPVIETSQLTICPDTETTISVQNPQSDVTYLWFRNGRNLRATGSTLSTSIQGNYQVLAVASGNFECSIFSDEIKIDKIETRPIYLRITQDKTTLLLEDFFGTQDDILNVEWYFEGEVNANLGTQNQIIPTEDGYYSARVTNQNGCIIQTRTIYFTVPKVQIITGEEDINTELFSIYPNPSTGIFNVRFPLAVTENIQISIFDATGKIIKTQVFEKNNQNFRIDLQGFSKGIYLIRFNQNNTIYSKSIILE